METKFWELKKNPEAAIGEAAELIRRGEIVKKVPEDELLSTLEYELDHWESK